MGRIGDASVTRKQTEGGPIGLVLPRSREAPMDQQSRNDELERIDTGDRTVSRRAFFSRARLGLLGATGVVLFGIATSTGGVSADEESEKEKKKTEEPRDKDREAKEKEKEKDEKPKKKQSKKAEENDENKSNTKKKKKNGDDSKKKADPAPASPHAKYVEKKQDRFGCTDFATQSEAQQVLRLEPKDSNNLDGNRNGIACDGQDAFMDGVAGGLMKPPFDLTPVSRP
jgi:hypothetical protein